MKVEEWTRAHAEEVAGWRYEPPYDFYDLASEPGHETRRFELVGEHEFVQMERAA